MSHNENRFAAMMLISHFFSFRIVSLFFSIIALPLCTNQNMNLVILVILWLALVVEPALLGYASSFSMSVVILGITAYWIEQVYALVRREVVRF